MRTNCIQHIVAMPAEVNDSQTVFQGFSAFLYPDYHTIIEALTYFPHSLLEASLEGEGYVSAKMISSDLDVRMLRVDLFDEKHCELELAPTVIWSTQHTVVAAAESLRNFKIRPLHLTLGDFEGAVDIFTLTPASIHLHLTALAERVVAIDENFKRVLDFLKSNPARSNNAGKLPFIPMLHNSTRPMAKVLASFGFDLSNAEEIEPSDEITPYTTSMIQMASIIDNLRKEQTPEIQFFAKNDAVVYCPSILAHMYKFDFWNQQLRNLPRYKRNFVKNFVLRNKGYSTGFVVIAEDVEDFNPYEDPTIRPMLAQRQFELRYFSDLISLLAINQFTPVFRLPGAVMLHHESLAEIYALVNSNKRTRIKELNKRISAYGKQLNDQVGEELRQAIFVNRKKILMVCDFPVEWMPIDLVPAMFRYEMSRVPPTPGNVSSHVLLSGPRYVIPFSKLCEVLIIRSFKDNDLIREHLALAIESFGLKSVRVNFVDVQSKEEVVSALKQYTAAIVIFDCHGNHGGRLEHGWLNIGNERVDVWDLVYLAPMPPIVILAACSTHALDGSHASVANGFLRSGVLAVLGTYAPVHSIHTAVLVARLLYRIDVFLPAIIKSRTVTWRELVSGFLRMSYVTDVLFNIYKLQGLITQEQYEEIHTQANQSINNYRADWIEELQNNIMKATNKSPEDIQNLWQSNFQFVETMLFTQLGRPENIIISDEDLNSAGG